MKKKKTVKHYCSIGKSYNKKGKEVFTWRRFRGGFFGLLDPIGWAKDLIGLFNVRKLVLYGLILLVVGTYFFMQGKKGVPVKVDIGYGKEAIIEINKDRDNLYINKKGFVFIRDGNNNILKQVSVGDIPGLKRKLAPIGFQLQPIFIGGVGLGLKGAAGEVGAGISFLRYWKMQLEAFLTQKGAYVGSSYKITDNSGAGLAFGKGWKGDNRMIFYYRFNF